jgi:hypothetical protein
MFTDNLTMFTEFNSTDDYYYLKAEQESWDEESEAARQVARLEKKVEELDEINKRSRQRLDAWREKWRSLARLMRDS